MDSLARSLWFRLWLALVLFSGILYSISSKSPISAIELMATGFIMIMVGGVVGGARTSRWTSWDGPINPTQFEWFLALTGFTLFLSPLLHIVFVLIGSLVWESAR